MQHQNQYQHKPQCSSKYIDDYSKMNLKRNIQPGNAANSSHSI